MQIDGTGGFKDANISPLVSVISLFRDHGQTILVLLYGLSIPTKLNLMKRKFDGDGPNNIVFHLCDESSMSMEELVMVILASEVVDELFTCSGEAHRMREFCSDIESNTDAYLESGHVILCGLELIAREFNRRRTEGLKHIKVMEGYHKIMEMSTRIQEILFDAGVCNPKLRNLPSFETLLDHSRIHRCHHVSNLADAKDAKN